MPEGDTVAWTALRLNRVMTDVVLTRSDIRVPRYAEVDIQGRTSLGVTPYGKHLFHHISGGITLHSHLKMEGRWSVFANPSTVSSRKDAERAIRNVERSHTTRALIYTADAVAVGSKLGIFEVIDTAKEQEIIGHLGPDILRENWMQGLDALRGQGDRYLGEALLDQTLIAGFGTMWISEMLFLYRLLPWTRIKDVDAGTLHDILEESHRRMTVSVQRGMRASADGRLGNVHARSGLPCVRCKDTIRVAMAGPPGRERTLFSCPTCQGGLAPNDDGRLQGVLKDRRRPSSSRSTETVKPRKEP